MQNSKIDAFAGLIETSMSAGTLTSLVFHSPSGGDRLKVKGTLCRIDGSLVVQLETMLTEGRVTQENITADGIGETAARLFDTFRKADLNDRGGIASLMISKKGTVTLLKKGIIGSGAPADGAVRSNDREKKHLLTGQEKFLTALGISDKNGRVHDKMQSKFRQIIRFSEYIVEAEKKLSPDGRLLVCDLCCGKSYLSFAAYHVLTELCHRTVEMVCVDLKASVMETCADIARSCGMNGMRFLAMNVAEYVPEREPDMVISLHACDTATDLVLDLASRFRAKVILATPCCHRYMSENISCPTLDFIADRPILRQKLCTAATDALRLLKLEAEGYSTDATELIDPEDTPKNVMLRAVRQDRFDPDSPAAQRKKKKYEDTRAFLYGE